MLVKATRANHKQLFGRISCIKMTTAYPAKTLQPLITTSGNFQKFGYGIFEPKLRCCLLKTEA